VARAPTKEEQAKIEAGKKFEPEKPTPPTLEPVIPQPIVPPKPPPPKPKPPTLEPVIPQPYVPPKDAKVVARDIPRLRL